MAKPRGILQEAKEIKPMAGCQEVGGGRRHENSPNASTRMNPSGLVSGVLKQSVQV